MERVGAGVTRLAPGDHVVLTFQGSELVTRATDGGFLYGPDLLDVNLSGSRPDGSSPLRHDEERVGVFFGQSCFATHALAKERNAIKINDDVPFSILAPLGGDVQTGAGVVINTLRPQPGSAVAIFGAGAIGLSAVMAARIAGCRPIIAIDIKASRLELAETVGATYTLDSDGLDPVEAIRAICKNGIEFSVETTGLPGATRQAVECLAPGGVCAVAGVAVADAEATLNLAQIRLGRTLRGSLFGDSVPALFIPRLVELYRQGGLPLERMVSEYGLDKINQAADDMLTGAAVKAVLMMPWSFTADLTGQRRQGSRRSRRFPGL